jgi:pyrrolidone-carboxylate peptidase
MTGRLRGQSCFYLPHSRAANVKAMRILLYGFGPYRQFRENITAKIIKAMPTQPGLRKVVFPVRFNRGQFIRALVKHRPDIVLGLGQSSRKQIDIESRARNRRRARKGVALKPIRKNGPSSLATSLKLELGSKARRSSNAGEYVCNYSMYVTLDHIRRQRLKTMVGFVHIPHDYDARKATKLVRNLLRKL